jgi:hypothetical protein
MRLGICCLCGGRDQVIPRQASAAGRSPPIFTFGARRIRSCQRCGLALAAELNWPQTWNLCANGAISPRTSLQFRGRGAEQKRRRDPARPARRPLPHRPPTKSHTAIWDRSGNASATRSSTAREACNARLEALAPGAGLPTALAAARGGERAPCLRCWRSVGKLCPLEVRELHSRRRGNRNRRVQRLSRRHGSAVGVRLWVSCGCRRARMAGGAGHPAIPPA